MVQRGSWCSAAAIVGVGILLALSAVTRADMLQNTAVDGTAASLAGFGTLNGAGIGIGLNESGVPNVAGGAGTALLPAGNPNIPAARVTLISNNITNHASETSGVIISTIGGEIGIAPQANIIAANNSDITPNGQITTYGGSYGSVNVLGLFQRANTPLINMSWGRTLGANNGVSFVSPFVDWGATTFNKFVVVAGNELGGATGSPSDAFNVINVAASGIRSGAGGANLVYNVVGYNTNPVDGRLYNLTNTTSDGRIKTDIVAPGGDPGPNANGTEGTAGTLAAATLVFDDQFHTTAGGINNGGSDTYNNVEAPMQPASPTSTFSSWTNVGGTATPTPIAGTSFAAPEVSGAASLLYQYGLARQAQPAFTDYGQHLAQEALILNGAKKTGLFSQTGNAGALTAWTRAPAAGGNKPAVSLPGGGNVVQSVRPGLDPLLGAGQLNVASSLKNLAAGEQKPGYVDPIGWDYNNFTAATPTNTIDPGAAPPTNSGGWTYGYDFSTSSDSPFTATLTWDRPVSVTANGTGPAGVGGNWQPGVPGAGGGGGAGGSPSSTLTDGNLADLDLYLFQRVLVDASWEYSLVTSSTSGIDNVEHLWLQNLPSTDQLSIDNYGGDSVQYELDVVGVNLPQNTNYGLAWAVPEPGAATMLGIGLIIAALRRRRAA